MWGIAPYSSASFTYSNRAPASRSSPRVDVLKVHENQNIQNTPPVVSVVAIKKPTAKLNDVLAAIAKKCKNAHLLPEVITELRESLNEALQNSTLCLIPKHFQVRVQQLSSLLTHLSGEDQWASIKTDVTNHLARMRHEARQCYEKSYLRGFWALHTQLIASSDLVPDLFSNAIGDLNELLNQEQGAVHSIQKLQVFVRKCRHPLEANFANDKNCIEQLIAECTTLIHTLPQTVLLHTDRIKVSLGIVRESYRELQQVDHRENSLGQLSGPGLHCFKLDPQKTKELFASNNDWECYGGIRFRKDNLTYVLSPHFKASMPTGVEWIKLALGQIFGYSNELFTFFKAQEKGCSRIWRLGFDPSQMPLTDEDKSWQFVISLLTDSVSDCDENVYLNSHVCHQLMSYKEDPNGCRKLVLACLTLIEQHRQSYERLIVRKIWDRTDLYSEKAPLFSFEPNAVQVLQQRLETLLHTLTTGVTFKEIYTALSADNQNSNLVEENRQSITSAIVDYMSSLDFESLDPKDQVYFVSKITETFPGSCPLPLTAALPTKRAPYFYEAVIQGHATLVADFLDEEKGLQPSLGKNSLLYRQFDYGESEENALPIAAMTLQPSMVSTLLRYDVLARDVVLGLSYCLSHFSESPLRAAAITNLLLPHVASNHVNYRNKDGLRFLHQLVNCFSEAPEIVRSLIVSFVNKGALLNQPNYEGKTALDLAIEAHNVPLADLFIGLGAVCGSGSAGSLESLDLSQACIDRLKKQDLGVRWSFDLKSLSSESSLDMDEKKKVTVLGTSLKFAFERSGSAAPPLVEQSNFNLSSHRKGESLDFYLNEYFQRIDSSFMAVSAAKFQKSVSCLAVQTFFDCLHIQAISRSAMVFATTETSSAAFVMRQKIPGLLLGEKLWLEDNYHFDQLNPSSFSLLVIASMLFNFTDLRLDDFVLESLPDNSERLTCINLEKIILHTIPDESDREIRPFVRNILYCLDQMKDKIDPLARSHFLAFEPISTLEKWIKQVSDCNEDLKREFGKTFGISSDQIQFGAGFISNLCNLFFRLQSILQKRVELSHLELLFLLHPNLEKFYEPVFSGFTHPTKRFYSLYFPSSKLHQLERLKSLPLTPSAWTLTSKKGASLDDSSKELVAIKNEKKLSIDAIDGITQELERGILKNFKNLVLDSSKERVVSNLSILGLKSDLTYGIPALKNILNNYYQEIDLEGWNDSDLKNIIDFRFHCPFLQKLNLSCSAFSDNSIATLVKFKYLDHLNLFKLRNVFELDLSDCTIKKLFIADCNDLECIRLPSTLKSLELKNCPNLSMVRVLGSADSKGNNHLLSDFSFENCPRLNPWHTLFQPWLEGKAPHSIRLSQVPAYPITKDLWLVLKAIARTDRAKEILPALQKSFEHPFSKYIEPLSGYFRGEINKLELCATKLNNDDLELIGPWFSGIKKLRIAGSAAKPGIISDAGLQAFIKNSHRLTEVEIAFCPKITSDCVESLAQNLPGLLSVSIQGCKQINDHALISLANHRPGLRRISFAGCAQISDDGVVALAKGLGQLDSVDFRGCQRITDRSLSELFNKNSGLKNLDVSGCLMVGESLVNMIRLGGVKLNHLYLPFSHKPSTINAILKAMIETEYPIWSLGLANCAFSPEELESLVMANHYLVYLDLTGSNFQSANFSSLKHASAGIEELNLSFSNLKDEALHNLLRACKNLVTLDLTACRGITQHGLNAIPKLVPSLQRLKFRSQSIQNNIRFEDIESLRKPMPHLQIDGMKPSGGKNTIQKVYIP